MSKIEKISMLGLILIVSVSCPYYTYQQKCELNKMKESIKHYEDTIKDIEYVLAVQDELQLKLRKAILEQAGVIDELIKIQKDKEIIRQEKSE